PDFVANAAAPGDAAPYTDIQENPKGILPRSPGLRGTSYPGCAVVMLPILKGLWPSELRDRILWDRPATTLSGLNTSSCGRSQGSSFLATGLEDTIPSGFKNACKAQVRVEPLDMWTVVVMPAPNHREAQE